VEDRRTDRERAGERLTALLALLDDPDPEVQASVRRQLVEIGAAAVPPLRMIVDHGADDHVRLTARRMIRRIGLEQFRRAMRAQIARANRDELDLEEAAFAIARVAYPELDSAEYTPQLDAMAAELQGRLRPDHTAMDQVRTMSAYLIEELGYHACRQENYYDPENSYVNRVIDRRIGIPISLCAVFLFLARRLSVPLFGVAFPAHFLLKYKSADTEFFVDPFNGGTILDMSQIEETLRAIGIQPSAQFTEPASTRQILMRMIRNLVEIYRATEPDVSAELETAVLLLSEA
jgi:regulator of sirC expression with transglutaminase-like and TPR domain